MSTEDRVLRDTLLEMLRGGNAHAEFADVVSGLSARLRGVKPQGQPHTAWQLLEHMRIALHDLLVFSTNPDYTAPKWPDDYWPKNEAPPTDEAWEESVAGYQEDVAAFENLVKDKSSNLYARIPWGDGQTLLREVLVAVSHGSYHLGQLVSLRKQLSAWESKG